MLQYLLFKFGDSRITCQHFNYVFGCITFIISIRDKLKLILCRQNNTDKKICLNHSIMNKVT